MEEIQLNELEDDQHEQNLQRPKKPTQKQQDIKFLVSPSQPLDLNAINWELDKLKIHPDKLASTSHTLLRQNLLLLQELLRKIELNTPVASGSGDEVKKNLLNEIHNLNQVLSAKYNEQESDLDIADPTNSSFSHRFQSKLSMESLITTSFNNPSYLNHPQSSRSSSKSLFSVGASGITRITLDQGNINPNNTTISPAGPYDTFKWMELKKLNTHLLSENVFSSVGSSTCFLVKDIIVIGTEKSVLLVYDFSQTFKFGLGNNRKAGDIGAVTSLAIYKTKYIASGHASGTINIWDLNTRVLLISFSPTKNVSFSDGHLYGVAIIHLAFLGSENLVSCDAESTAFYHKLKAGFFNKTTSIRIHNRATNSNELSSTSINETPPTTKKLKIPVPSTIYSFSISPVLKDSVGVQKGEYIFALSSPYKVAIYSNKPIPQVIFRYSWKQPNKTSLTRQSPGTIPMIAKSSCLAWRPWGKSYVLACSSDKTIYFFRQKKPPQNVIEDEMNLIEFELSYSFQVGDNVLILDWLNPDILLFVTKKKQLVLYNYTLQASYEQETFKGDEFERIVCRDVFAGVLGGLFKGLGDDDVDVQGPELGYSQSFSVFRNRIFILEQNGIEVGSLQSWDTRLTTLVRSGHFKEAIELALEFYHHGCKFHAVTDLDPFQTPPFDRVGGFIIQLLTTYVDMTVSGFEARNASLIENDEDENEFYKELSDLVIQVFLEIDRVDVLLSSDIFERFYDGGLGSIFLEQLEPYIVDSMVNASSSAKKFLDEELQGLVHHVSQNPRVVNAFLEMFEKNGLFDRLGALIIRLDPTYLDLNQIIQTCRKHGLYIPLFYVYMVALRDCSGPVVEMLRIVDERFTDFRANHDDEEKEFMTNGMITDETKLDEDNIYILYVYIASLLSGKVFPTGATLNQQESLKAKSDIYNFIFSPYYIRWPSSSSKFLKLGTPPFPYLRLLLLQDVSEFLKIIGIGFDDPALNGEIILLDDDQVGSQVVSQDVLIKRQNSEINRQFVLDSLLSVLEDQGVFPKSNMVLLYAFIARNYGKYSTFLTFDDAFLKKAVLALVDCSIDEEQDEKVISKNERHLALLNLFDFFP